MNGLLVTVVIAVLVPLLVNEASDLAPWLANRLVKWGAHHLGSNADAARYEEEWLADLERVPGKLTKLAHACLVLAWSVPRMRRQFARRRWLRLWNRWRMNRTIARWTPLVWHVVRARGLSRTAAEEAVQEVWSRYARQPFKPGKPETSLGSWLVVRAREQVLCTAPGADDTDEPTGLTDRDTVVWRAHLALSPDDQELLRLAVLTKRAKGFRRPTLSGLLGTSASEAHERRNAALDRLRQLSGSAEDRLENQERG